MQRACTTTRVIENAAGGRPARSSVRSRARLALLGAVGAPFVLIAGAFGGGVASASSKPRHDVAHAVVDAAVSSSWCSIHGSSLVGWTGTTPDLPICGAGPAYGGTSQYVNLPGPGGLTRRYFSATPGFQCVELADRFLAVVYGLAPVDGNGESVAANYHAAYPATRLYVDGTRQAVGHAPQPGDVLSLSSDPSFQGWGDGHVAVVVASSVNRAGNGSIVVAQENVASTDYHKVIDVVGWRLEDPQEPSDPEYQFPYAEWLHIGPMPSVVAERARLVAARARAVEMRHELRLEQQRLLKRSRFGLLAFIRFVPTPSPFIRSTPAVATPDLLLGSAGR